MGPVIKMTASKNLFRTLIGILFWITGAPLLTRAIVGRKRITILAYHNPDPGTFEKHIRYLKRRFHFITITELVQAIKNDDWTSIRPNSVAITIDDGYKENYKLVSLFAKYALCPTIYLCSHIVNTNRHYWYESGPDEIRGLKKANHAQLLHTLKEKHGYEPDKEYEDRQALNDEEMKAMVAYADFQSHSRYHPILTKCDSPEVKSEIAGSKIKLEALLNKSITHFSYPNGDYSDREVQELMDSGYESARTLDVGWNHRKTDPYKLKAMAIQDDANLFILGAQVHGFFGYLKYASHGSLRGARPSAIS
jgi:peptidoglycan/xylan/chitin deacetylase (PgdA/CDA1 family)